MANHGVARGDTRLDTGKDHEALTYAVTAGSAGASYAAGAGRSKIRIGASR